MKIRGKIKAISLAALVMVCLLLCLIFPQPVAALPSVMTQAATNIAPSSATLNGNLLSCWWECVWVSFEYGFTTQYELGATPEQIMVGIGTFDANLGGLIPGATYHFRAKADDHIIDNTVHYGEDMTFTTTVPPEQTTYPMPLERPTVVTVDATGVATSAATLNGRLTHMGTAENVDVFFRYGQTVPYSYTTPAQTMSAPGDFSASISDLNLDTTYHFMAVAVGDGTDAGDDLIFDTPATPQETGRYGSSSGSQQFQVDIKGVTSASAPVTESGLVAASINAVSPDGDLSLQVAENTLALDSDGNCLTEITMDVMDAPPDPPENIHAIGLTYDFGPSGATFEPPLALTVSYNPEQLPPGITEDNLYIAWFDGVQWIPLEGVVDTTANTVTAYVSHFTAFTVIYELPATMFSTSNLKVTPGEVEPAQEVTISVIASNNGGSPGMFEVVLRINGTEEVIKQLTLDPGASQKVSFSVTRNDAATYAVDVNGLTGSFIVQGKASSAPLSPKSVNWWLIAGITAGVAIAVTLVRLVVRREWS